MAQTDAPPAEAPPQAPEAQPAPPIQEAPAGQRSTGGERPQDADPKSTPLNRESAQELMRKAYSRSRAQRAEDRGQREEKPAKERVDAAPKEAVQEEPTPAPDADAPADAPARERDPSTGRFKAQGQARRPAAEAPSPAPSAPEVAPVEEAPAPSAPAERVRASETEAFRSERWQAAFADDPGLRRRVDRINADPALSSARKAELLSEKLVESVEGVQQERTQAQQIAAFRQRDPQGYVRWQQQQEAVTEQNRQLELRITQMIADAYGVDASDPDFMEAGPQEGDDHETGLQRFVAFTSSKSPVLKRVVEEAVAQQTKALTERYEGRLKAQEERHKEAMEVAVERARSRARSPMGAYRAPPRTNGTGQRPVGEDDGAVSVPAKAPDAATVRGLIGLGYQRRE